jgi:hypothetical protein
MPAFIQEATGSGKKRQNFYPYGQQQQKNKTKKKRTKKKKKKAISLTVEMFNIARQQTYECYRYIHYATFIY